ncbi:hypothetical protein [Lacticaseibacillus zhaodongensis]|uniref:hypothetical protein n=1 Tax=Lacticaseibacillus zhaodongensis TaxID=2668065 RepID=UPI0012D332FE|nr:hypothetical protein [Lacticaseibacillus zhaodongensis]
MKRENASGSNKGIKVAAFIVAVVFIALGAYLTKPKGVIDYMSTIGFGILLTLGLIVLTVMDGRARSRGVRFFADWLTGTILLAFVHLYMIGLEPQWLFLGAGSGIIAVISLIVALRTKFVYPEQEYDATAETMVRRRRRN